MSVAKSLSPEFRGKQRKHKAFITVSCSGPEAPVTRWGPLGRARRRDAADLRFTTADCDWFYAHFREPNYDTTGPELHRRLVNPARRDLYDAIARAGEFLSDHVSDPDWDGGQMTFIYAGHGASASGAWVLRDGLVTGVEIAERVATSIPRNRRRCRVDLVADSCFAGAFFAEFLSAAWNDPAERLFVCTVLGAALSDEYAWEYEESGHGAFTFMFKSMFPLTGQQESSLSAASDYLHALGLPDLRHGGVAALTNDEQHPFEYENGDLSVIGAGFARVERLPVVDSTSVQGAMRLAAKLRTNEEYAAP